MTKNLPESLESKLNTISLDDLCEDIQGLLLKSGYFSLTDSKKNDVATDKVFDAVKDWVNSPQGELETEDLNYTTKIGLTFLYRHLNNEMPTILKDIAETLAIEAKTNG